MIGFIVVTHGLLGQELINTAEFIVGKIDHTSAVSVDGQTTPDSLRKQIERAIKAVDQGDGVVILTDMFGGTPSNLSLSFLGQNKVEVLTGVNLPIIIKLVQARGKLSLSDLAKSIAAYGRQSIHVAGEMLNRRPKS